MSNDLQNKPSGDKSVAELILSFGLLAWLCGGAKTDGKKTHQSFDDYVEDVKASRVSM